MMRKGLALEMIIMLIMLLVVAAVIINLLLGTFGSNPLAGQQSAAACKTQAESFIKQCEQLCNTYRQTAEGAAAEGFCSTYYIPTDTPEKKDWLPCDGKPNDVTTASSGAIRFQICEDRIYCFHLMKCGRLDVEGCRGSLCKSYKELYRNVLEKATQALARKIEVGTCVRQFDDPANEDWAWRYGYYQGCLASD